MNLIFRETPYVSTRGWDSFYREDHFLLSIKKALQISSEVYEFNELEKRRPLCYTNVLSPCTGTVQIC